MLSHKALGTIGRPFGSSSRQATGWFARGFVGWDLFFPMPGPVNFSFFSSMPLSEPVTRIPQHLRDVSYRSFQRSDGLWDIEGELVDRRHEDILLHGERKIAALTPIHHMLIRATVDSSLQIHAIEAVMERHPLDACPEAAPSLQKMVGQRMSRGWRKAIADNLGGAGSCTHLRELLFNMATAAHQTMHGTPQAEVSSQPPGYLGQCLGWDFDGPGVAAYYPQFIGYESKSKALEAIKIKVKARE